MLFEFSSRRRFRMNIRLLQLPRLQMVLLVLMLAIGAAVVQGQSTQEPTPSPLFFSTLGPTDPLPTPQEPIRAWPPSSLNFIPTTWGPPPPSPAPVIPRPFWYFGPSTWGPPPPAPAPVTPQPVFRAYPTTWDINPLTTSENLVDSGTVGRTLSCIVSTTTTILLCAVLIGLSL